MKSEAEIRALLEEIPRLTLPAVDAFSRAVVADVVLRWVLGGVLDEVLEYTLSGGESGVMETPRREFATQRCPQCGHHFRVLADEANQHPCPRCGYAPGPEDQEDDR